MQSSPTFIRQKIIFTNKLYYYIVHLSTFVKLYAKSKGAKIGRPLRTTEDIPTDFLRHYPSRKKGLFNLSELTRICELSRTTVYNYISIVET